MSFFRAEKARPRMETAAVAPPIVATCMNRFFLHSLMMVRSFSVKV